MGSEGWASGRWGRYSQQGPRGPLRAGRSQRTRWWGKHSDLPRVTRSEPAPQLRSADFTALRRSDTEMEGPKVGGGAEVKGTVSRQERIPLTDHCAPEDQGLSFLPVRMEEASKDG